ncbi:hypothetical protein [Streptomyces sp. WAC 04229]|uniref:hypothetical protein n=1 Tax=Streptomyces sp. WAC 04229 TaxID=2203206 RepID=UPI00163C73A1|nr:hypothetical protein [Streptomyces sp. WAC 04229]
MPRTIWSGAVSGEGVGPVTEAEREHREPAVAPGPAAESGRPPSRDGGVTWWPR